MCPFSWLALSVAISWAVAEAAVWFIGRGCWGGDGGPVRGRRFRVASVGGRRVRWAGQSELRRLFAGAAAAAAARPALVVGGRAAEALAARRVGRWCRRR